MFSGEGKLEQLQELLRQGYTQLEIDTALENAIAYSQIPIADYLLTLGAQFSHYNYQGVYYAVHNNEFEGLKYAIQKGVDINVNEGMLINESIITAVNTKDISIVKWLLDHGADTNCISRKSFEMAEECGTTELKILLNSIQ